MSFCFIPVNYTSTVRGRVDYPQTFLTHHKLYVPVPSQEPEIQFMSLLLCLSAICILIWHLVVTFECHHIFVAFYSLICDQN